MAPIFEGDGSRPSMARRTHQEDMIDYIKVHFSDVLGEDTSLLDRPAGLDALAAKVRARLLDLRRDR
jgi:hypothetical protein